MIPKLLVWLVSSRFQVVGAVITHQRIVDSLRDCAIEYCLKICFGSIEAGIQIMTPIIPTYESAVRIMVRCHDVDQTTIFLYSVIK